MHRLTYYGVIYDDGDSMLATGRLPALASTIGSSTRKIFAISPQQKLKKAMETGDANAIDAVLTEQKGQGYKLFLEFMPASEREPQKSFLEFASEAKEGSPNERVFRQTIFKCLMESIKASDAKNTTLIVQACPRVLTENYGRHKESVLHKILIQLQDSLFYFNSILKSYVRALESYPKKAEQMQQVLKTFCQRHIKTENLSAIQKIFVELFPEIKVLQYYFPSYQPPLANPPAEKARKVPHTTAKTLTLDDCCSNTPPITAKKLTDETVTEKDTQLSLLKNMPLPLKFALGSAFFGLFALTVLLITTSTVPLTTRLALIGVTEGSIAAAGWFASRRASQNQTAGPLKNNTPEFR